LLEQICNYCYSIIGFTKCQGYVHTCVFCSQIAGTQPSTVITNLFKQFIDLVNQYPNCKLTFLEVPHYSIVRWNITRGHRQPEVFATQDNIFRYCHLTDTTSKLHGLRLEQLAFTVRYSGRDRCSLALCWLSFQLKKVRKPFVGHRK
jgi:hypothetical protein